MLLLSKRIAARLQVATTWEQCRFFVQIFNTVSNNIAKLSTQNTHKTTIYITRYYTKMLIICKSIVNNM